MIKQNGANFLIGKNLDQIKDQFKLQSSLRSLNSSSSV